MSPITKEQIARDWLTRYTGMPLSEFGDYVLLTNFRDYVRRFADRFGCEVRGEDRPMQAATNQDGLTIINFGIGSPNAATVMDLLTAHRPKGVLFLGKCGGLKHSTEIGHFILPIGAIRGEGTSDDYMDPLVPALPSFKLHKFVSQKLVERGLDYRTGVVYTTNRRVWEHDEAFRKTLHSYTPIGIDMETATLFSVGFASKVPVGALLLVSDLPLREGGVKTRESARAVFRQFTDVHIEVGIEAMSQIAERGEHIRHYRW